MFVSGRKIRGTDVLEYLANLSSDEVFTPPKIANEMLDLLPQEIWQDKDAKFLDPCCKSGIFLREIAIRLDKGLKTQIPDHEERKLHILKNQVYGIAITELTALISRRTVYCSMTANGENSIVDFSDEKGNIMYDIVEHNWDNNDKCTECKASYDEVEKDEEKNAYPFIHTGIPKEFRDIEFDVIIGNPPYHMSTSNDSSLATPLYNKFIERAKNLNPRYIVMIVPARWYTGGMGLNNFRAEMINDRRMSDLTDYPVSKECFPENDIKGGVCYFLWDKNYLGDCNFISVRGNLPSETIKRRLNEHGDVFIRDVNAHPILRKIKLLGEASMMDSVESQNPFGIPTKFRGSKRLFKGSIKIYQTKSEGYTDIKTITKNSEWVGKHKVIVPKAGSGANQVPDIVLSKPKYSGPNSACSETYVVVGMYKSKEEAENAISYIQTKFFRFLVNQKKITQDALRKVYEFVPMQDFSKPWTDEELYEKYRLTKKEINYIEKMIRPMD